MSEALYKATTELAEGDLSWMVLAKEDLPDRFKEFPVSQEIILDNEAMAEHGIPGTTPEETRATGRLTGYLLEFTNHVAIDALTPGSDILVATVVHMFEDKASVSRWMSEKFVREFRHMEGQELKPGQQLISVDVLQMEGFSDEAVAIRSVQTTPVGVASSTIVDFRVGRLLGVAYNVVLGDIDRTELVRQLGVSLEMKIVRVLLGAI